MTHFTMLSSMADRDFETALDKHVSWGLEHLDLKNAILGKDVTDLTPTDASCVMELIEARGLSVYCMSTTLFHEDVEIGESAFRKAHLAPLNRVIEIARVLKPDLIRLLGAKTHRRNDVSDSISYLEAEHPWVIESYREAVEKLAAAGFSVTIENECHDCIFSTPEEILGFFDQLDCGEAVNLTWDVQNLWQMGTFPSLEVYEQLKPLLAYYHLKGGQAAPGESSLRWRSSLEDASWPVEKITNRVVSDGVSPVICLNGSHGERKEGYDYANAVEKDLDYVKRMFGDHQP
jgi:sugar phosphate isomerase/epimerase